MGMYNSVGIDFYFEVDPALSAEQKATRYRCSNTECKNHRKEDYFKPDNFCSSCGSEIEGVEVSLGDVFPDAYDFCEKHLKGHEIFCTACSEGGGMPDGIWRYNLHPSFEICSFNEEMISSGGVFDLSELNVPVLIDQFMQEELVKVFLEAFESVYGKGYLTPKLGLFSTWG